MTIGIGRRQFISALGGAAVWPGVAWAQSGRTPRLGVLIGLPERDPEGERWLKALREGLEKLGWKEGAIFGSTCAGAIPIPTACK